jgi:hypothetical protein
MKSFLLRVLAFYLLGFGLVIVYWKLLVTQTVTVSMCAQTIGMEQHLAVAAGFSPGYPVLLFAGFLSLLLGGWLAIAGQWYAGHERSA